MDLQSAIANANGRSIIVTPDGSCSYAEEVSPSPGERTDGVQQLRTVLTGRVTIVDGEERPETMTVPGDYIETDNELNEVLRGSEPVTSSFQSGDRVKVINPKYDLPMANDNTGFVNETRSDAQGKVIVGFSTDGGVTRWLPSESLERVVDE